MVAVYGLVFSFERWCCSALLVHADQELCGAGRFGGLAFHIAGLSEIFPYSQIILGLSSQDEALPIDSITTLVPMVLVYTVLFAVLATHHLKKADVVAG